MTSFSISETRREINRTIKAAWDLGSVISPVPPVDWGDNQGFDKPVGTGPNDRDGRIYGRCRVISGTSRQVSVGTPIGLNTVEIIDAGVVMFDVFVVENTRQTKLEDLAGIVKTALEAGQTVGGISFELVTYRPVGPSDGMYQGQVVADFRYNRVR